MSDIKIPEEKVYFVYNTELKRRETKFYSRIGPAKSFITGLRRYRSSPEMNKAVTNKYIICEMMLKLDSCNQYRYDEKKNSVELTEMAKAIYL